MRVSQNRDKPQRLVPDHYSQLHGSFQWLMPEQFNIAQVCCARWAQLPDATKRVAIHAIGTGAAATFYTYSELQPP